MLTCCGGHQGVTEGGGGNTKANIPLLSHTATGTALIKDKYKVTSASAYSVIFEKKLVNRKGLTVHSAIQIEMSAFRRVLNRRKQVSVCKKTHICTQSARVFSSIHSTAPCRMPKVLG